MDPLGEVNASMQRTEPAGDESSIVTYGQTPAGAVNASPMPHTAAMVQARRDVFWQNVTREVLMAMAAAAAANTGRVSPTPKGAASSPSPVSDMFDGRMGIITTLGQRIPIADVIPVFAVSRPGCPEDRARSNDVQCSVFRISTPSGESYTLPIHHITGVHSMSDALANQLEAAARQMEETDETGTALPFGFAAYTSLARSEAEAASGSQPSANSPDPSGAE